MADLDAPLLIPSTSAISRFVSISTYMMTVQPEQAIPGELPEPRIEGHRPTPQVIGQVASRVGEGLLNNIRRIEPGRQATVHPHRDHALQPGAVPLQEPTTSPVIAAAGPLQQCIGLVAVVSHRTRLSTTRLTAQMNKLHEFSES